MTPCCIVEEHHQVLPFWNRIAGDTPLDLILTLDHHTDVLPAFSRMETKPEIRRESVTEAVKLLRHDEHIDWALRAGITKRAVILSHENFTLPAHQEMRVICPEIWPESQEILNSSTDAVFAAEQVIESEYLHKALSGEDFSGRYILDIDLDNFLCAKSVMPTDRSYFLELAEKAAGISFSLERDWQKILRFRGENITSDEILQSLFELFRQIPLDFSGSDCIVPLKQP